MTIKKKLAAVAVAAGVTASSGIAYAYWTAGGSGTGSATTRPTTAALTAVQTSTISNMYPGDDAQTLTGNFTNPNPGPIYVSTVTAAISSVTKAEGAPAGVCDASDYSLTDAVMTVNEEVPAGTAQGSWTGADLQFNNKSDASQDACKDAVITLTVASD